MTDMLSQDEIDQLLTAISSGDTEPEDFRSISDERKIRLYDFKRPDKFSTDQTRSLKMMHETFARQVTTTLSAQLRSLVHVHVATVEQLTYEEFIRSLPTPTTLAIINMDPLNRDAVLEIDPSITFSIVDRLFGGKGQSIKIQRELTDIEKSVMESVVVKMLANMREAWNAVIDLRPRLGNIETTPQFVQIVAPTEIVVSVTLEVKIGEEEGIMNLCLPYITLEPVISKLSPQIWYAPTRSSSTEQHVSALKEKLANVELDVAAQVGNLDVTVEDVLSLSAGDVIRLPGVQVGDPFTLTVGKKKKFYCQPGILGSHVAVQILDKIEDITEEDLEYLSKEGENYYE